MLVRPETPDDTEAIRHVHTLAFMRDPGQPAVPPEVPLVDDLRDCAGYVPALSLVAVEDGAIVGHVIATRATVGTEHWPVLGLGPLGVVPERQRTGVGSLLMHAIINVTEQLGEPLIVLLGSPEYYPRFGFELASRFGIDPPVPEWVPHFLARPGPTYDPEVRGRFAYAEPFDRL